MRKGPPPAGSGRHAPLLRVTSPRPVFLRFTRRSPSATSLGSPLPNDASAGGSGGMTSPGGPEAFGESELALLIAQYRSDALRVARRLVRSEAEAEDLTQTAILNVLRRAEHI